VLQLLKLPDGTVKVLVEGSSRAKIVSFTDREDYHEAKASLLTEPEEDEVEIEALARSVVSDFENYVKLNKKISPEVITRPARSRTIPSSPTRSPRISRSRSRKSRKCSQRCPSRSGWRRRSASWKSEISVLQVEKRIRSRVKRQMEKTQREYYLNEQMKAIQKELGEGEDGRDEVSEIEARIKKTKLSKEAREKADAELKKLRTMSPMSAEATVVRNYLDWLLSLPWGKNSKVKYDLNLPRRCSTPITSASTRSRSASSSILPCRAARTR
jgi:ATP-dependent Lon protease